MVDRGWRRIAARQAGTIHIAQLDGCSLSRSAVHRLVGTGVLRRVHPRVYALEGSPSSDLQKARAAQLWSGYGTLCGNTSARLMDLVLRRSDAIHIHVPGRRRPPNGVTLWRGDVPPVDQSQLKGLRITTMPRTVVDCARHLSERELDVLLDSAIRKGMLRSIFMERMRSICVPGRPGGRLIRKLVSERDAEQGLTGSAFERLLLRAIKRARLPLPVCQWPCVDRDFCAYIDLAYPELGIAIEADGYRWHDGRQAFEADRNRASELASRGWRVIQVTWLQLKYDSEAVVTRLDRALRTPPMVQLRA